MKILVTGGAGYIGSHTCVSLLKSGYDVVIVDNLCNSKPVAVERIETLAGKKVVFYKEDVCDREAMERIFFGTGYWRGDPFCRAESGG